MALPQDFEDLLRAFEDAEVRYLIIGGYAVSFHAAPRFTKDLDLWIEDTAQNVERARSALIAFGAPSEVLEAIGTASGLDVVWMGRPPMRIDMMKQIPGGDFDAAWSRRVATAWDGVPVLIIAKDDLIAAKTASAREQDLLDAAALERSGVRREDLE